MAKSAAVTERAVVVMETTETAAAVTTMTVALNGNVGGCDRKGGGDISKGALARK
jgi:hypothetical protein